MRNLLHCLVLVCLGVSLTFIYKYSVLPPAKHVQVRELPPDPDQERFLTPDGGAVLLPPKVELPEPNVQRHIPDLSSDKHSSNTGHSVLDELMTCQLKIKRHHC